MQKTKGNRYIVKNVFGIRGETEHRTPEAACKAAAKREGDGWIVEDLDGNRWTMHAGMAVML